MSDPKTTVAGKASDALLRRAVELEREIERLQDEVFRLRSDADKLEALGQ